MLQRGLAPVDLEMKGFEYAYERESRMIVDALGDFIFLPFLLPLRFRHERGEKSSMPLQPATG